MAKEIKKKNVFSSLSKTQKILLFLGLPILALPILPVIIILFIGLLPTLTILITDTKNSNKLIIVGCFNLAGVFIYIMNIINNYSIQGAFSLVSSALSLSIMLGAAAVGIILYNELPNLFVLISDHWRKKNLSSIDIKLKKLEEDWGSDILKLEQKTPKTAPKSAKESKPAPTKQAS